MDNWKKLQQLTAGEKKLLAHALLLLPLADVVLRIFGYKRLVRLIESRVPLTFSTAPPSPGEALLRARTSARMVSIAASRGPFRATCLRRSLALIILLRRQGIDGELCFGTRFKDRLLEAHAWVEVQGMVVNDRPDIRQHYTYLGGTLPATQAGL
jgi:hypothetical protein